MRSDHDRVTARPDRSELGVMSLRLRLCLPVVCSKLRRGQRLALLDTNSLAMTPPRIVGCGLHAKCRAAAGGWGSRDRGYAGASRLACRSDGTSNMMGNGRLSGVSAADRG